MAEPLKILMLEDSAADAEIIQRFLLKEKMHCKFTLATSKKAYLRALDDIRPDLILSDHTLPQFNSADALAAARLRFPGIPFIMVTGAVSEEFAVNIIKLGADDYILKDRLNRLPLAIDTALRQRQVQKEKLESAARLKMSEENYRTIMERVSDGFVALNKDWQFTYVNKEAGEILDRKPQELISKHIWTEFPESISKRFYPAYHKAMEDQQYIHLEEYYPPLHIWLENHIYPSADGLSVFFRDITEQKEAEQKIIASEEEKEFDHNNLHALINNTRDLMWSIDKHFSLLTSNNAFDELVRSFFGEPVRKGGNVLASSNNPAQMSRFKSWYERAFKGESFTEIEYSGNPQFWSEISFYPIYKGNEIIGTACYSRDITERKKTETSLQLMEQEILKQKIQEQKKITRAMIRAEEKERNRIGQELHDNINQILAGTKLYLGMAGNQNPQLKELIHYPLELIDNSINEIRLLSSKHVTPEKNIDLQNLLQSLLENLRHSTSIKTVFNYLPQNRVIEDELKLNIYRIVQEQANNIVKHAAAKNILVSVEKCDNLVHIIISDDGKGFNIKEKRKGVGISNIINRVQSFNGEITIDSSPGNGCTLKIKIPY
jgi:PAS domain S-box-containing protein